MAARAARAQHGPRLLEGPLLFKRIRRIVAELVGAVWLAGEVARFIRTR
jgi:hypothetical protein